MADEAKKTSQPAGPGGRRERRMSRRVLTVLSATLAVAIAISVGLMVKGSSSGKADTPTTLDTNTRSAVPAGWKLTFNGSFPGTKLNTKTWATCFWWSTGGCTNYGNDNQDKEWYQPSQVQVSGGALHLVAQHVATTGQTAKGAPATYSCRSGMVTSYPGFSFEYGYVQIVARIPYNTGLWPAFWLAAADRGWPPEIDILEHWNLDQQARVYLHPTAGPRQGGPVDTPANLSQGWHTISLSWTKTSLTWYIDGVSVFTTTTNIPRQAMYLVANLADVSTGAGSCTGQMLVQSVKVWQP
jgi:beta-glucanase (GH16 family)